MKAKDTVLYPINKHRALKEQVEVRQLAQGSLYDVGGQMRARHLD